MKLRQSKKGPERKRRAEPEIEWREYPLIQSREYPAYCKSAQRYRDPQFKRWTCLLRWDVLTDCLASIILSGQRQLDFPLVFERYQQQSGLWEKGESRGLCGISKGGGKRGKPVVGFPLFPRTVFFHSSPAAAFYVFVPEKKLIIS